MREWATERVAEGARKLLASDRNLKSVYVCLRSFVRLLERKSDRKTLCHSSLFANLPVIIRKMLNKIPVMGKVLTVHGERYRFILEWNASKWFAETKAEHSEKK